MKRIKVLLYLILITVLTVESTSFCYATEVEENGHAQVLYISAYGYDWNSVPYQINGVSSVLGDTADLEYVFMNTKKFPYDSVKQNIYKNIKALIKRNGQYDLVIVEDDAALDFILEYQNDLFENVPVVFMGINTAEKANLAHENPLITGMIECFPYHETIALAAEMYPNATQIVGISDATDSGQGCSQRFFDEAANFPQLQFSEINASNLSREELAKELAKLDNSTILLFLALVNDGDGNIYSLRAATDFVAQNASIPMFKADMIGIGMGVLGGYVSSYEDMGKAAAQQALLILNGTSPADIPVDTMGGYPFFDHNIMEKYHISNQMLPEGSVILNPDISFFQQYRMQLLWLTAAIAVLIIILVSYIAISRQKMNRRLQAAVKKAETATKEKTAFLARMSHDMRTPMNTIINLTRMVEEELDNSETAMEDLRHIETSNQFLLGLIDDILDMSRIEAGKMILRSERYSYQEFLNYISCTFEPLARQRGIQFSITPGTEYVDIIIDKVRFNQVCFNLISNALKYTEPGGHVSFIMIHEEPKDGILPCTITIADDGIGMSEEFQKTMFSAFTQEGRSYKTVEGAGLGLSIVKNILNAMGGSISVQSESNKGSVFTVKLNMVLAQEEAEKKNVKEVDLAVLKGKHALLAEDHPMNQQIAKRLLDKKGMTVTIANNGQQAVQIFSADADSFDVILMDLRMPIMDGLRAAKVIRALEFTNAKTIPIIAMTANTYDTDIKNCMKAGMNAHIAKPIEPEILYSIMAKNMESKSYD